MVVRLDAEDCLDAPQRQTKRADFSIAPVADASNTARIAVHVDFVLPQIDVVCHHGPVGREERGQTIEHAVYRLAEALGEPVV